MPLALRPGGARSPPVSRSLRLLLVALLTLAAGCRAAGCAANVFGDVFGATGDARCDRRFVPPEREPASFCQEIVDTLATSQFQDDCRETHAASTGDGRCPRERVLGGCKLHKVNDDGSEVWDWYYDVSDLEVEAGLSFEQPARTTEDVKALCADRERYEEGATFFGP
mgnify:CR=1 FL=1